MNGSIIVFFALDLGVFICQRSVHAVEKNGQDVVCPDQYWSCYGGYMCVGNNVSFIPRLPRNCHHVTIQNGKLGRVSKATMKNLTFIHITKLILSNNTIKIIDYNAFQDLSPVGFLTIAHEPDVNVTKIRDALKQTNKSKLRVLNLNDNGWRYLPHDMFQNTSHQHYLRISLKNNNLKFLNLSIFNLNLGQLNLNLNALEDIYLERLPKLTTLRLGNNKIRIIPKFCSLNKNSSYFPNLKVLKLNNNRIEHISNLQCLEKLRVLSLSFNLVENIPSFVFNKLSNLQQLDLINIGRPLKTISEFAFQNPSLKKIKLRENNYQFGEKGISLQRVFGNCAILKVLDLSHNDLFPGNLTLPPILSNFPVLRKLIMDTTHLVILSKDTFGSLKNLEELDMTNSRIYDWADTNLFGNITLLRSLSLEHNNLNMLRKTSFPPNVLNSLERINLAKNPFHCNCSLMWFMNWLRDTKIEKVGYPSKFYKCSSPGNMDGVPLNEFNPTIDSCTPWNPHFTTAIVLSAFVVVVSVLFYVVVKCQMYLKNYIYLLRVKSRQTIGNIQEEGIENKYEYHAFIIYCHSDENWVHNHFVKKLERDGDFRFCIHQRDFEIGERITDNIDTCLKKSWKVVVIMSNDFAKSEWCQWEVDVVQERRRRQGRDVVVPIMLENISSRNMTGSLLTLLDSTSYLSFQTGFGENMFWRAVTESLRKPIGLPPVSVL